MSKDKEKYNAYMKSYMLKRYKKKRNEAVISLGGRCIKCGSIENLEFDHLNPKSKSFTIANILYKSNEVLQEELKKCQLLCHDCHKEKNKVDNGEAKHGSLTMYTHYRCRCKECKIVWSIWQKEYKIMSSPTVSP